MAEEPTKTEVVEAPESSPTNVVILKCGRCGFDIDPNESHESDYVRGRMHMLLKCFELTKAAYDELKPPEPEQPPKPTEPPAKPQAASMEEEEDPDEGTSGKKKKSSYE